MDIWVISSVGLLQISCYEHSCTGVYMDMCFPISWVNIQELDGWVIRQMYTELFKQVANYFPKWLCHLNSYQQCSSSSFTSLPTLNMVRLFSINKITGVGSHSLLQGNLPDPEIKPGYSALQAHSLPAELPGEPQISS